MSEFYADILDASNNRLGDGPLTTLLSLSDRRSLDQIGDASFAIPAQDPRAALIAAGGKFDLYDRVDGYLGRFLYKSKSLGDSQGEATLSVSCYDQLRELSRESVNFRRTYTNTDVATVVAALVALKAGWSATVDAAIGNTTITYEGESILIAVDALRDRWNKHYRLGAASVLEFGAFGADSGVVLTNLRGQITSEIDKNVEIAIVDKIGLVEETDEIFNRVTPLGAGQGVSQLTIQTATLGSYAVQVGVNADASNFYYIEDVASVAAYGRRDKVLTFPEIRPITNSDANILNAANALKLSAEAYIARHLLPKVVYSVSVRGLRKNVTVGDTVRLAYRGVVEGYAYVDVDDDFYVMDISRQRQVTGERSATLTIASIAERRTADTDVMLEVVNDLKALKIHVPITLDRSPVGPYTLRIDPTYPAEFTVRFGTEVLALNYAILRFRTSPLKSSITTVQNGGSSTPTSSSGGGETPTSSSGGGETVTSSSYDHRHEVIVLGGTAGTATTVDRAAQRFRANDGGGANPLTGYDGGHTHDVTTSNHTHTVTTSNHTHTVTIAAHNHALTYGIYQDTNYPQVISVSIDGVDRTAALGGTWAPGNATVEVEVDITTYLVNAVGGLRQNHRVRFSCTAGKGEIEAEVAALTSIQAIAVAP